MLFGTFLEQPWDSFTSSAGPFLMLVSTTGGCAGLSNLLPPPLFCLFHLRAKWLSWQQIAVSSPTATTGTSWPTVRQQGTARCWRWGVNCVIPQGCIWSMQCLGTGDGRGICVRPPFRCCEVFIFNAEFLFFLSASLWIINRSGRAQSERQREKTTLRKRTGATLIPARSITCM